MISPKMLHGKTVYLDSNILIYGIESGNNMQEASYEAIKSLFLGIESGAIKALTSQLTLSEVLVLPLRDSNHDLELTYRHLLSGTSHFSIEPITLNILNKGAYLRAHYKSLKLADALHLATSIESTCDIFLTADKRLRQCEPEIPVSILED